MTAFVYSHETLLHIFRIELIVILISKGIKEQETPGVTITPTVEYEEVSSKSNKFDV